jgi:peptidoglycan/xylan/chitin deacetylase (PgdA/CDA1 family)
LVSLLSTLALVLSTSIASAKPKRHQAPRAKRPGRPVAAAPARPAGAHDHQRFEGGGTGGDSPKNNTGAPELLFTFDDGPIPANTPKVLDALDKHHIKAVFFVCGVHIQGKSAGAEKGRQLVREEIARGHMVGNHTIHHLFLCNRTNQDKVTDEVEGNGKLIADALGEPPYLFRTPYGAHCPTLATKLAELGIRPIGWDIDPQDWRLRDAVKIEAYVKGAFRRLTGRNILLLHDVQAATVAALPKILDDLDQENERRKRAGEPVIKVIDYEYLMKNQPSRTPILDEVARVASEAATAVMQKVGTPK